LGKKVSVSAPTGRAAQRATEVTGYPAKTIHSLLEIMKSEDDRIQANRFEGNPLECDVLVIDEMSMVDSMLMQAVLCGIRRKCVLIMVGDSDQLPSVGAGNVLHDLINSKAVGYVRLTEIFRQAQESLIVTNSHRIINGEFPELRVKDSDFFFFERTNSADVINTVIEMVHRLARAYKLNPKDDIQVLTPARKGLLGSIELNKVLQDELNPENVGSGKKIEVASALYKFRSGDKIMQNQNNYNIRWTKGKEIGTGVFNGDIGTIIGIDPRSKNLIAEFDGREATYSSEMLFQLELAYAITVHKSQGSEFNTVIMPLFDGFNKLFYRNLFYTAVTRAKSRLILIGSQRQVKKMVDNNFQSLRYTALSPLLSDDAVELYYEPPVKQLVLED
jgi:exodeoxyribonuclease V alpha subunit